VTCRFGAACAHAGLTLLLLLSSAGLVLPARADTVYLCRSYSGGRFWSERPCAERQALIDRMVSVPAGLPFDQQVKLGEQARADGERLSQPMPSAAAAHPARKTTSPRPGYPPAKDECARLAHRLEQIDTQSRQPQSGDKQDRLTAQKRKVRERQAKLGC
jgi:hypothetical protein